ncbi:MAG TPA: histone deacetylase [bacterium]|nr:histone deacetylase [bacterium]
MKFIWSSAYEVELFGHIFPVSKYRLIKEAIIKASLAAPADFVAAKPATTEDLLLVHTPAYLDDLVNLRWTERTAQSEMALTPEIVRAYMVTAGGTIEAARWALKDGVAIHIGGGYHHAYPDHAEGFCYINDVGVAIARLRKDGAVRRVCVIDCDLHQGNGTAVIFAKEPDVFTFSIHQENNYPPKVKSDLDIGLPDGADDALYLAKLSVVGDILADHKPEFCLYLAGADPFRDDVLGGLALTKRGLKQRDALVLEACRDRGVPVAIVFAGGYAVNVQDVVDIHVNTVAEARRIFPQA